MLRRMTAPNWGMDRVVCCSVNRFLTAVSPRLGTPGVQQQQESMKSSGKVPLRVKKLFPFKSNRKIKYFITVSWRIYIKIMTEEKK